MSQNGTTKKRLDAYLVVLVESDIKKAFLEKAKSEDRTISSAIRTLMKRYIDEPLV